MKELRLINLFRTSIFTPALICTFFLFAVLPLELKAQQEQVKNQPYADLRPFYWGFNLGLNTQDLQIKNAGFISPKGVHYFADVPSYRPGFAVGVFAGTVFYPGYELKCGLNLAFADMPIAYSNGFKTMKTLTYRHSFLNLPLEFKYCASRLNNFRPYISGGPFVNYHIGGKQIDLILYKKLDYGVKLSVGFDFYFSFFKLSPELSFSYGFNDLIQHDRPSLADDPRIYYTKTINRGRSRMIALTLNFQ